MAKTIRAEHRIYAFSPEIRPVATVSSGETLTFETIDALGGQLTSETDILAELDFARVNPATGPVCIDDAEPGDALVVFVRAIETASRGAIVTGPGLGVLGDEMAEHTTRILPIVEGCVVFGDVRLPVAPMIGVIGVAPSEASYPTGTAHRHGGNMDTKEIAAGAKVVLPVARPGGLLALGDVHAVMGDGEVCVSACEVDARVTVELQLVKGGGPAWPLVEFQEEVFVVVSLPTIDEALTEATRQAVRLLQTAHGLSLEEACMLASLAVDIRVSQLVDPNKTAKAMIPKRLLKNPLEMLL